MTTGASLFQIGNADAAIVNRLGKGWAIYLNTTFDQYPKQRAVKFGGSGYRDLANALFNRAGVRPVVEVTSLDGHPITQAQLARYKFADSEILTLVKENVAVAGIVGQDGVTTYNDSNLGQVAKQELTIKLPRKFFVTDVRMGKQVGYTDVIHASILIGDALVFALSPRETRSRSRVLQPHNWVNTCSGPQSQILAAQASFGVMSIHRAE